MNVLIIEDEKNLAQALCRIMEEEKWQATAVYNGQDSLQHATQYPYDIIVMDIMLPGLNGFDIVKELRNQKMDIPVLMLSALDEIPDKVKGLNVGADDYMTKPFSPAELLARIRVLTRRKGEVIIEKIEFGDLVLSLSTCELECNGKSIHLAYKEFEIMKLLMYQPKILTSKEELINSVWGNDSEAIDNNVEAYISFLRKKTPLFKK
ncbi:response regulator transcription factor [Faecalitalea cylindroides]|uniref:response regulator transcription factor n=1 Tax=Faecalitalea cylindroides TaxID=39483 RepID=UPI0024926524|nr:response regulator transcription factor [Faecalitalea cylindroides]